MRIALWPAHHPVDQIEADISRFDLDGTIWGLPSAVFVADRGQGRLGGFVEVSMRAVADGCITTPVGYLEGWYVDPDLRRQAVGRALVEAVENWAMEQGCVEMASDCESGNHTSHLAHLALGYGHTDNCILFRKTLKQPLGAQPDYVGLMANGLWPGTAYKLVTHPAAGGVHLSLDIVRVERNPRGNDLLAVEYEPERENLGQMRDFARRARQRWPILRLAILHRMGRVDAGEPSALIAVSAPTQADAFAAGQWLSEALAGEVAIPSRKLWAASGTT